MANNYFRASYCNVSYEEPSVYFQRCEISTVFIVGKLQVLNFRFVFVLNIVCELVLHQILLVFEVLYFKFPNGLGACMITFKIIILPVGFTSCLLGVLAKCLTEQAFNGAF